MGNYLKKKKFANAKTIQSAENGAPLLWPLPCDRLITGQC